MFPLNASLLTETSLSVLTHAVIELALRREKINFHKLFYFPLLKFANMTAQKRIVVVHQGLLAKWTSRVTHESSALNAVSGQLPRMQKRGRRRLLRQRVIWN